MANDSTMEMAAAAQAGNIDLLYTIIKKDRFVLEHIDEMPFVDTPLHIAAFAGDLTHVHFAVEIMRLKPSFAWKLNEQGWSPIHVALQKGHKKMVLRLVDINKDLIRIKGREGITPMHFVSRNEDTDLLAEFLMNCPDSIEEVTIRGETALHIAVKDGQHQALQVLVGWLQRKSYEGSCLVEKFILNWKDETGSTIMHISALNNDIEALDLLINTGKMDLDIKNLENSTALDKASNAETKRILLRAVAKRGSSIKDDFTLVNKLRSKITFKEKMKMTPFLHRNVENISAEQRNAYLIIATLMVTAIYQAALSPPGGVFQADNGANNLNNTSAQGNIGKSVMPVFDFAVIMFLNALAFVISTWMILILTPAGPVGVELIGAALLFTQGYFYSLLVISPSQNVKVVIMALIVYYLLVSGWMIMRMVGIGLPSVLTTWRRVQSYVCFSS